MNTYAETFGEDVMEDVTSAASYSDDGPVSLSLPAVQWNSGQRQRINLVKILEKWQGDNAM